MLCSNFFVELFISHLLFGICMEIKGLSKEQRHAIFAEFHRHRECLFSDIEKATGIPSNLLNYHLSQLAKDGLVAKKGLYYCLTRDGESVLPSLAHLTGKELPPLSVAVSAVTDGSRILLLRRAKRPYQGYWVMPGGKICLGEDVEQAALREAFEETGLVCRAEKVCGLLHEHLHGEEGVINSFHLYMVKLVAPEGSLQEGEEGSLRWFSLDSLPERIVPSDRWMIENFLSKRLHLSRGRMKDGDSLSSFRIY